MHLLDSYRLYLAGRGGLVVPLIQLLNLLQSKALISTIMFSGFLWRL